MTSYPEQPRNLLLNGPDEKIVITFEWHNGSTATSPNEQDCQVFVGTAERSTCSAMSYDRSFVRDRWSLRPALIHQSTEV